MAKTQQQVPSGLKEPNGQINGQSDDMKGAHFNGHSYDHQANVTSNNNTIISTVDKLKDIELSK